MWISEREFITKLKPQLNVTFSNRLKLNYTDFPVNLTLLAEPNQIDRCDYNSPDFYMTFVEGPRKAWISTDF